MPDDDIQAFFDKLAADNGPAAQQQADKPGVSPADLVDRQQQSKPGISPAGLGVSADVLANARDAVAETKNAIKDSPADIGREELGQLPTQAPPRQHYRPKL